MTKAYEPAHPPPRPSPVEGTLMYIQELAESDDILLEYLLDAAKNALEKTST